MKKPCIICDIDRVLVDSREWEKHIPSDRTDRNGWNNLLKYSHLVKPNKSMLKLIIQLSKLLPILFVTSREDYNTLKMITKNQIKDFSNGELTLEPNHVHKLFMRKANDFRDSDKVKEDILNKNILPIYEPILAIDDNADNIKMFKRYDIPTYHYKGLCN